MFILLLDVRDILWTLYGGWNSMLNMEAPEHSFASVEMNHVHYSNTHDISIFSLAVIELIWKWFEEFGTTVTKRGKELWLWLLEHNGDCTGWRNNCDPNSLNKSLKISILFLTILVVIIVGPHIRNLRACPNFQVQFWASSGKTRKGKKCRAIAGQYKQ